VSRLDLVRLAERGHARTAPHRVAVICSDYERSKRFDSEVLGLEVVAEVYREARRSYKLDLRLPDGAQVELFRFPEPPRASLQQPGGEGIRPAVPVRSLAP
jgi:glyoxylase I family protein